MPFSYFYRAEKRPQDQIGFGGEYLVSNSTDSEPELSNKSQFAYSLGEVAGRVIAQPLNSLKRFLELGQYSRGVYSEEFRKACLILQNITGSRQMDRRQIVLPSNLNSARGQLLETARSAVNTECKECELYNICKPSPTVEMFTNQPLLDLTVDSHFDNGIYLHPSSVRMAAVDVDGEALREKFPGAA